MDYNTGTGDINAVTITTGVVISHAVNTGGATAGCTLGVGTYYFPLGSQSAETPSQTPIASAQLYWAAAVAGTITVETCNFPVTLNARPGVAAVDVTDYNSTSGLWIPQNPSTAIVPVVGSGNSSTAATVTAGGSAAGACEFALGNLGARRVRIKIVTTVGGLVRCNARGKQGA